MEATLNFIIFCVIFILVISFVGYLMVRPIILWYFKINTLISTMAESNSLLREIRDELKNGHQPYSSHTSQNDYSEYMPK